MRAVLPLAAILLSACAPAPQAVSVVQPETTLPLFGGGYPDTGDPCRRVGEAPATVEYLDHTADLVACPEAWDGREAYASGTKAEEVIRQDGWVVYSIPLGI